MLSDPVIQSSGGTIDVVARVTDPGITTLYTFIGGINLGTGMNDLGLGADQLAGDGLWTTSVTVPPNPPTGRYVIDHIAIDTNVSISDAFPRLRIHQ